MSAPQDRILSIGEIYELSVNNDISPSEESVSLSNYPERSHNEEALRRNSAEEPTLQTVKKPRRGRDSFRKESIRAAHERFPRVNKRPRWKQLKPSNSSEVLPVAGSLTLCLLLSLNGSEGHCMVSCSNRIYSFGGYFSQFVEGQCYSRHCNILLEYSFLRNSWSSIYPEASGCILAPQPRRHASMVFYGQSLYVFGGFTERHEVLGDLWSFDLTTGKWSPVTARLGYFWPAARAEHSAVIYKDKMIIFGGYDGKRKLCDTVALNMKDFSWEVIATSGGYYPNRRCKHSAVVYGNKMYVLGGFQFVNDKNMAVTDLVTLNLENMTWNLELMNGCIPECLQAHKAVVVNDSMYIFGGKIREQAPGGNSWQSSLSNVVWRYRFSINSWSLVECEGSLPKARQLHGACVVKNSEEKYSLIIYGGVDRIKETYYDDMWELEGIDSDATFWPCNSCEALKNLVNSKKFADLELLVDGYRIPAHRCILYSKCDYFRRMLESDMKESFQNVIEIRGIGYSTFLKVLFYIYTGRPVYDMDYEQLFELLVAADMLGLENLQIFCMKRLEEAVNVQNVSSVCQLASQYNAGQLKTFCMDFIVKYFSQVVETKEFEDLLRKEAGGLAKEILRLHAKVVGVSQ